ncbi:MAG: helix-turn-helix domain-containing protein, partial [Solirubrobacteraceae bacterium]|nr:helix-turn-helix domain-containing protein [Solirubrobacteraceae bacterium]
MLLSVAGAERPARRTVGTPNGTSGAPLSRGCGRTTPAAPGPPSLVVMTASENVLGEFLRARREAVAPAQAGIPEYGVRRVPGLRREEVAMLAGISADYYLR